MAIATFSNNPNANTGITLSGTFGGGSSKAVQSTTPTSNQYLLSPAGGNVLGDSTNTPGSAAYYSTAAAAPDLSSYDQGINAYNAQLNNLTPQLGVGLQSNANNYQTTLNGLEQGKLSTDKTYNLDKTNAGQDFVTAKNAINTNTGSTINSVSRLLGARGAAGQSAGNYAALLAANQGTQQRANAATGFAKNSQILDNNYNDYVATYNQNKQIAGQQKTQADNQVRQQYDTNRANLLQSLASLVNQRTAAAGGRGVGASQGYTDEANSLLAEAAALNTPTPVGAIRDNSYVTPTLASYTVNPTAITAGANAGAAQQSSLPFLSLLQNRDKTLAGA